MSFFFFKLQLVGWNLMPDADASILTQAKTPTHRLSHILRPNATQTGPSYPCATVARNATDHRLATFPFQIQILHASARAQARAQPPQPPAEKWRPRFRSSPRMWTLTWKLAPCKVVTVTVMVVAVVEEVTFGALEQATRGLSLANDDEMARLPAPWCRVPQAGGRVGPPSSCGFGIVVTFAVACAQDAPSAGWAE